MSMDSADPDGEGEKQEAEDIDDRLRGQAEREQLLEQVEHERRLLDAVLEALPVGVVIAEPTGKLVRMNRANEMLWGAPSPRAAYAGSIDEYGEWVGYWPGTGRRIAPHEWAMARALTKGEAVLGELVEIERFDGTGRRRMINTAAPVRDAAGRIIAGVVAQLDVTDRERAAAVLREKEEQFRLLADNISPFAWIADAQGRFVWFNRRWFEYTGTTLDEMERWDWTKVHHPDHVGRVVEKLTRCFETGEPWEDTFPLRGKDGSYRWFLSRAQPVRDDRGVIVRWFGTNTDVTAERELSQALLEADRRKDEFLATLAHELRNPLAPLRNGLGVLKTSCKPENAIRVIEIMDRQLEHMVHLIDDLLDVSRVSRGKVHLRKQRVQVSTVIESAIETSKPLVDAHQHRLTVSIDEQPMWIDADPTRIAQVISNIINNAAKYTPTGGRIDVVASREGGHAIVRVTDTGVGIPPDMLPRVFDMFTQVGRTLERSEGGLGIGLSLAKQLVEMHGGTIEAASNGRGHGSTFIVRLPLCAKTVVEHEPAASTTDTQPSIAALRVLVVDDYEDSAETLAMLVEGDGHATRVAFDGPTALEAARSFRPDVVFLDIGLPGVSGYDVARQMRSEPTLANTLLVALTGWGAEADRLRSQDAGIEIHLTKPVSMADVRCVLARAASRDATAH